MTARAGFLWIVSRTMRFRWRSTGKWPWMPTKESSDSTTPKSTVNMEVKISPESTDPAPQAPTDASAGAPPTKPKRTRRVGEPKPKRYPVGEKDPEQGV